MKKSQAPAHTRCDRATTQFVTNLPIVQEDSASGPVAKSYAYYRQRFGRPNVPGILKCFATHPSLLEQMIELASNLLFVESHLTLATKEMIATFVSVINACPYCLDSHASFLRQQGTGESYKITAADIQLLQDAGWQQLQIAEAVHISALFACFNRVANAFGLPSQQLFEPGSNQTAKEDM